MKRLTRRSFLLIAAALTAAALAPFAASTGGLVDAGQSRPDGRVLIRLGDELKPEGFEAQVRGGEVVGMTALKKGGRAALKQQGAPPCPARCPAEQKLTCWADEAQATTVCVCGTGDEAGGAGAPPRRTTRATREVILAGGASL